MSTKPRAWVRENHRSKTEKRHPSKKVWEVVYTDPKTNKRRTKGGFRTKSAAQDWADQFADTARRGQWIDPSRPTPTFREVAAQWLATQHFDRENTSRHYRRIIEGNNDLTQTFNDVLVGEITTEDVKKYVKAASGRLAAQTIRHRLYVLRFVLDEAVESNMIGSNPARGIRNLRIPKQPTSGDHERKQRQSGRRLTPEQIDLLVAALPEPYDLFIRLLAFTGMRPEEACGLVVGDVDVLAPDVATLHVHQVVVEANGRLIREDVTKTPESNRVIGLDPDTSLLLTAYMAEHRKRAARWFPTHPEHEHPGDALPLFVGAVVGGSHDRSVLDRLDYSKPMRYGSFYKRYWSKAREAAGLPKSARVYDLRHTHASLLMDNGALTFKEVQVRLGHKDGTMLMNRYWHTREQDAEAHKAAGAAVAAAFKRKAAPENVTVLATKRSKSG